MFRQIWLVSAVFACLAAPTASASYQLDSLEPLDDGELSSLRAGFLGDDFMVNIGLDIATSINGETLFNNRIANLFFQNGQLIASQPEVIPVTTVVQVGSNNSVDLPTSQQVNPVVTRSPTTVDTTTAPTIVVSPNGSAPPAVVMAQPSVETQPVASGAANSETSVEEFIPAEQPVITVTQVTGPVSGVNQSSINRVIQNSLNNTVINFETVVNIDAQVNGALKRLESRNRVQQALQFNFN
ncbi:hypothetical protein [Vibrio taketomensis]|uniref:hypothetical protein n=1 Tax=Vibrio taketomensis TaxID=2572923 RepID=UPI001389568E|nr:hypothetical protein [Vibrio taketomensis]